MVDKVTLLEVSSQVLRFLPLAITILVWILHP